MDALGLLNKEVQVAPPHTELTDKLTSLLPTTPFHIKADDAQQLTSALGISLPQLMMELIPIARSYNKYVPVSDYIVGSCAMGLSGDLYLGMNLEFARIPLGQTVHSEQFVTCNALGHHEQGLRALAVSSEPCGHCRQFLNELQGCEDLLVFIPNKPTALLSDLLPRSFGPKDLGVTAAMMASHEAPLVMDKVPGALVESALQAANYSYAPYSHCNAGIAIRTANGQIFQGWYSENAAFNPTMPPFQMAVIQAIAHGCTPSDIRELVLVELADGVVSQVSNTRPLLEAIAPEASFSVYYATR